MGQLLQPAQEPEVVYCGLTIPESDNDAAESGPRIPLMQCRTIYEWKLAGRFPVSETMKHLFATWNVMR